jgi:hypothetical protein
MELCDAEYSTGRFAGAARQADSGILTGRDGALSGIDFARVVKKRACDYSTGNWIVFDETRRLSTYNSNRAIFMPGMWSKLVKPPKFDNCGSVAALTAKCPPAGRVPEDVKVPFELVVSEEFGSGRRASTPFAP